MLSRSAHKFSSLLVSFSLAAVVVSASSASEDSSAVVSVSASVSSVSDSAVVYASVAVVAAVVSATLEESSVVLLPHPVSRQPAIRLRNRQIESAFFMLSKLLFFQIFHKTQKALEVFIPRLLIGDPYGNRTHDSAVKGRCLNRLTNGPKNRRKKRASKMCCW